MCDWEGVLFKCCSLLEVMRRKWGMVIKPE